MKFLADENIDSQIVARLRIEGHDVAYIAELAAGISDEQVLAIANHEDRLLVTEDKDFGELVFRMQRSSHGVLLLRIAGLPSEIKANFVVQLIADHAGEMFRSFTVVTPQGIRIRQYGSAVKAGEKDIDGFFDCKNACLHYHAEMISTIPK